MVGGRIWTFYDIFPDDGEPVVKRDANGKKIIPPVAKYVFGAAVSLPSACLLVYVSPSDLRDTS